MPILLGGVPSPDSLSESKVNLANKANPVDATYAGSVTTGSVVDNIWTRTVIDSSNHIIFPTDYTRGRLALGYNSFSGSERLRVNGSILTTSISSSSNSTTTLSILGGSYYGNITGTFTATRSLLLPNASGTIALTSNIHTFSNEALLDTYTNTNSDITTAVSYAHEHNNIDVLDLIIDSGDGSSFLDNSGIYRTINYSELNNTPTEFTPSDHSHTIIEIDEFDSISNPQDNEILRYDSGTSKWLNESLSVDWSELTNIPSTFTPSSHEHIISDITDIVLSLETDGDILMLSSGEWINFPLHIFSNESILDNVTQDIIDDSHTHTNLSILEQLTQDIIDDTHTHTNFTLLETITDGGAGTNFLSDDGTYKAITLTVGGSDTQIIYNNSGSSDGDSTFTFNNSTKTISGTIFQTSDSFYIEDNTTLIYKDGSNNLVFEDAVSGAVTLADIIAASTNYWTSTTGGIYYENYISNHIDPAAELDINGQIITDEGFISSSFRYTGSNLLIGPNAGDNEGNSNRLYIHNSDTATPLIYGEFNTGLLRFYANVYIPNSYSLNFGSSTNSIYRYSGGDYLTFKDGVANSGNPIFLTELIDGTYNARVEDFDDLTTVQGITSSDTSIWDKASVIITGGSGDLYLANDGTYKPVSSGGLSTHMYLHDEVSDIGGGYEVLLTSPANSPEDTDTVAVTTGTSPVLIDAYATESDYPGITEIPAGLWTFKTWLSVDNAVGITTVTIRIYKRDTGGTETELFNVTTPEINSLVPMQYLIESVQAAQILDATDRLVIKYYTSTSTATSINVTLYYEGTAHYSYIIIPIVQTTTAVNDNIFDWDTSNLYYTPYTDKTAAGGASSDGKFYLGTDDPDDSTRLNYDGNFHATYLESIGNIVVGNDMSVTGTIEFTQGEYIYQRQTLTTDTNNDWREYSDSTSLYIDRYESSAWENKLEITTDLVTTTTDLLVGNTLSIVDNIEYTAANAIYSRQTLGTDADNDLRILTDTTEFSFERYEISWSSKFQIGADYVNIPTGSEYQINGTAIDFDTVGAEEALGNPASDGYVLSSTAAGVRSWVEMIATGLDLSGETTNGILYNDNGSIGTSSGFLFTGGTKTAGAFYTGTSNPSNSNRLNYDGYFHVSRLYSVGDIDSLVLKSNNASKASGYFYTGTTDPSSTDRLNYDGNLYSTYFYGRVVGATTSGDCLYGFSGTGTAIKGSSTQGYAARFYNNGSQTSILPIVNIEKGVTGTVDANFDIISITDNPTTSGTISGKVLTATIGTTERISLNPRVANGASAIAYLLDTDTTLSTSGSKLLSIKNSGNELVYINRLGEYIGQPLYINSSSPHSSGSGVIQGVYTGSSSYNGVFGVCLNTGYGVKASTSGLGGGLNVVSNGSITSTNSSNLISISREQSGIGDNTGDIINIIDNPTVSGTKSGSVLKAIIDSTERISLNPRVSDGAGAVAYTLDTHNNLATTGAKLLSIRNNGSEKFYVDYAGNTLTKTSLVVGTVGTTNHTIDASSFAVRINGTVTTLLTPNIADSGSSIAYTLDTYNTLSTTGAKLLSLKNATSEKFYIDKDGGVQTISSIRSTSVLGGTTYSVLNPGGQIGSYISGNIRLYLNPNASDGASAVAHNFDTENIFSTAGAELLRVNNHGTKVFAIDKDGDVEANSYNISGLNTPPSSASDTGTTGEIRFGSDGYLYLCTATNTWLRTQLTTW